MNPASIVFQAPVAPTPAAKTPVSNQAVQPTAAQSADSNKNASRAWDFAGTLSQINGKPGRKSPPAKAHPGGSSGESLPTGGTASPAPAAAADASSFHTTPIAATSPATISLPAASLPGSTGAAAALSSIGGADAGADGATAATGLQAGGADSAVSADGPAAIEDPPAADAPSGTAAQAAATTVDGGAQAAVPVAPSPANAVNPGEIAGGGAAGAANATLAGKAAPPAASVSESPAAGARFGASAAARASASVQAPPAGGGTKAAAFANALRSGENRNDDNPISAGSAPAAGPGGAAIGQPPGEPQINLALAEGSDATGATASALQAAGVAAATPPPAIAITSTVGDGPSASSASSAAPPSAVPGAAIPAAAPSAGLAADGGSHAHGGAGDAGSGFGGNAGDGAAALQQLTATTAATAPDSAPAATLHVHASVDSADFPQGVADRVSFAVDNNWSTAKLQVTPPQLGPIDLQIAIQGDHAQVMMSTHSAVTREALEASLPKLKEMLGSQGFTQVSVDISQRSFQDRSAFSQPYEWAKGGAAGPAAATPVSARSVAAVRGPLGVLDAYA